MWLSAARLIKKGRQWHERFTQVTLELLWHVHGDTKGETEKKEKKKNRLFTFKEAPRRITAEHLNHPKITRLSDVLLFFFFFFVLPKRGNLWFRKKLAVSGWVITHRILLKAYRFANFLGQSSGKSEQRRILNKTHWSLLFDTQKGEIKKVNL